MVLELSIYPRLETLSNKEDIVEVMVQDTELGLKRSTTLPC